MRSNRGTRKPPTKKDQEGHTLYVTPGPRLLCRASAERDSFSLPVGAHLAYLPLGLLQPRPEFPLLPFKGSTAALQLLSLLQQLGEVILQLALLLLQLEHLQL